MKFVVLGKVSVEGANKYKERGKRAASKAKSLGFSDRQIAHLTSQTEDAVRAERHRAQRFEKRSSVRQRLHQLPHG